MDFNRKYWSSYLGSLKIKEIQEMLSSLAEIYLHVNNLKNINLLSDSENEKYLNQTGRRNIGLIC